MVDERGSRSVQEIDITPEHLEKTFNRPEDYNEWVISDYDVLGIFAAHPYEIWVVHKPSGIGGSGWTNIDHLTQYFPGQPIYTFFGQRHLPPRRHRFCPSQPWRNIQEVK